MTPTPPSTSSSGHSPEDAQYRVVRKRNRVPLSCAACRHRKLKCNRSNPCENCVKRGDAAGCSYAPPGSRKRNQAQASTTADDMQNRIDRLEGLVLSLMTNGAESSGPTAAAAAISRSTSDSTPSMILPQDLDFDNEDMIKEEEEDSDVEAVSNSFGILKVDSEAGKSLYLGDSHWHLVLADIAEVKNYFVNHKRELEAQYSKFAASTPATAFCGPAFLFGAHIHATEAELRAALPTKGSLKKLVSRFFNSLDPAVYFLHYPTFHKALQEFIRDPSSMSLVWVGLLYAVLTLAMQSYEKSGDEPPEWKGRTTEQINEFRMRTVQCLITSDYTKSAVYTIETLLLYVHGEYGSRTDTEVGMSVIVSMIVRLAMRMGYHRDPKHFPGITPYQSEMRRRVWTFIRLTDIMFSYQLALPSMIRKGDHDVDMPRNIFEDELSTDSTELPASRPNSEPTPISYMLTKFKLVHVFGEIVDNINSLAGHNASYETVMVMDQQLREVRDNMPQHLKARRFEECVLDPATLLLQRFYLDVLFQKAVCVLHRRYITRARQNSRYAYSRRVAVEAALAILDHQKTMDVETKPGGRLQNVKWNVASLTKQDFLLGAMVVTLDLNYDSNVEQYDRFWSAEQHENMVQSVETSHRIWSATADDSMEAFKASKILKIMLDKVRQPEKSQRPAFEPQTTNEAFGAYNNLQPEHSAAMTLGMLSSGGLTPNTQNMLNNFDMSQSSGLGLLKYGGVDMNLGDGGGTGLTPNYTMTAGNSMSPASPFTQVFGNMGPNNMVDIPNNLDWDAWDSYVQNGNPLDPSFQFYPPGFDASTSQIPELQNDPNTFNGNNSVFMGANTPGRQ